LFNLTSTSSTFSWSSLWLSFLFRERAVSLGDSSSSSSSSSLLDEPPTEEESESDPLLEEEEVDRLSRLTSERDTRLDWSEEDSKSLAERRERSISLVSDKESPSRNSRPWRFFISRLFKALKAARRSSGLLKPFS
jgi:hypothetical protein